VHLLEGSVAQPTACLQAKPVPKNSDKLSEHLRASSMSPPLNGDKEKMGGPMGLHAAISVNESEGVVYFLKMIKN
jgi:hypothetical protein